MAACPLGTTAASPPLRFGYNQPVNTAASLLLHIFGGRPLLWLQANHCSLVCVRAFKLFQQAWHWIAPVQAILQASLESRKQALARAHALAHQVCVARPTKSGTPSLCCTSGTPSLAHQVCVARPTPHRASKARAGMKLIGADRQTHTRARHRLGPDTD